MSFLSNKTRPNLHKQTKEEKKNDKQIAKVYKPTISYSMRMFFKIIFEYSLIVQSPYKRIELFNEFHRFVCHMFYLVSHVFFFQYAILTIFDFIYIIQYLDKEKKKQTSKKSLRTRDC